MKNLNGAKITLNCGLTGVIIGQTSIEQSNGKFCVALLENDMLVHFDDADFQQGIITEIDFEETHDFSEVAILFLDKVSTSFFTNSKTEYIQHYC